VFSVKPQISWPNRPFARRATTIAAAALFAAGCTGLDFLFGPPPGNENSADQIGIAVAEPAAAVSTQAGSEAVIRWADIAALPGTVVRVEAQLQSAPGSDIGDPIQLVGEGTTGSGRDALADGDNDIFNWDVSGVRAGEYVIIATIEAPDGTTETALSRDVDRGTTGVIIVTTDLPAPTLTFTDPGDDDVTVTTGTPFTITWTDNGTANEDAVLLLGLDTDTNHDSGNEIVLTRDNPLSENGDNGSFVFNVEDENGNPVPDDTYNLFAVLDDGVNTVVTVTAEGQLLVNP